MKGRAWGRLDHHGGASQLENLDDYLEQKLKMSVRRATVKKRWLTTLPNWSTIHLTRVCWACCCWVMRMRTKEEEAPKEYEEYEKEMEQDTSTGRTSWIFRDNKKRRSPKAKKRRKREGKRERERWRWIFFEHGELFREHVFGGGRVGVGVQC